MTEVWLPASFFPDNSPYPWVPFRVLRCHPRPCSVLGATRIHPDPAFRTPPPSRAQAPSDSKRPSGACQCARSAVSALIQGQFLLCLPTFHMTHYHFIFGFNSWAQVSPKRRCCSGANGKPVPLAIGRRQPHTKLRAAGINNMPVSATARLQVFSLSNY